MRTSLPRKHPSGFLHPFTMRLRTPSLLAAALAVAAALPVAAAAQALDTSAVSRRGWSSSDSFQPYINMSGNGREH